MSECLHDTNKNNERISQQYLFFSVIYFLASNNVKYHSHVKNFMSNSLGIFFSYIAASELCICKNLEIKRGVQQRRCFNCSRKEQIGTVGKQAQLPSSSSVLRKTRKILDV